MSDPFLEGQESKKVPCCHDQPPQYDSYQPTPDLLTSVIENEHDMRISVQRLRNNTLSPTDYPLIGEAYLNLSRLFAEAAPISAEIGNLSKERTDQNTELHIAISRLTQSEFDRTYVSLRRDPNRQTRHKLAQDHNNCAELINRDYISTCSCDRSSELSAKGDKLNDKLGQTLKSHDTVNVLSTTDDAPAQRPRRFWKRMLKGSGGKVE
ncbi:unnamed protein product [Penicillium glandicola]